MRARRCARMKTLCSVVVIACITTVSALSIPIHAPMKTPPARISAAPLSSWSFHRDVHSHRYTALTMVQGESRGPRKVFFRGDQVPATWLHVPPTWRGTVLAAALHHESTFGMIDNDSPISEVVTDTAVPASLNDATPKQCNGSAGQKCATCKCAMRTEASFSPAEARERTQANHQAQSIEAKLMALHALIVESRNDLEKRQVLNNFDLNGEV